VVLGILLPKLLRWGAILLGVLALLGASAFMGYRWGRAGCELAHVEAQLDLSQKIRRADEQIERESPSQASIDTILKRLDKYAVDRDF
jgi:hypothetical protein